MSNTATTTAPALSPRAKILSGNPLFAALDRNDLETLAAFASERPMRKDETLFRRGDPGSFMIAVLQGEVRIVIPSATGKDRIIRVMGAGEVLGEIALLDGAPRTADAIAVTNGRLLVLERRDVLPRLRQSPDLCIRVVELLCRRLRATSRQVEDLVFHDVATRLAAQLLELTANHPRHLVDITQKELGAMVNATRESVNKTLRGWEEQGIVALSPGRVTVKDPQRLTRFAPES
jgi:CRP-like cAMP-binding protein